jgi:ferredoxin
MPAVVEGIERAGRRLLGAADAFTNRLYGWRYNPLYQSGTIVVVMFLALIGTGLWLLLFYRVGDPWGSVSRLTANPWIGNWVRGLHRYASAGAIVATVLHALRMVAQHRFWGPRALAWLSGLVLVGLVLILGWTGYVMVWDTFGQRLAIEGARFLDALPILSEPVGRAFTGERAIPGAFFFLNLFVHVALPLGLGLVLWVHVSRLARPTLLPPKRLGWTLVGLLTAVAILWPLSMEPVADPFYRPALVTADYFYAFWLPFSRGIPAAYAWLGGGLVVLGLLLVPRLSRGERATRPASEVDESICTGCWQCYHDCPYDAIRMLERHDGRADVVARVAPDLCVSCGICAGSCAPMGVGPVARTGRDQLEEVRTFLGSPARVPGEVVAITCEYGALNAGDALRAAGAVVYPVDCAGNLHTSVIELAIRGGAGGVLVLACPPRDCRNREGPKWTGERIYHDRDAELQSRVDRRRVAMAYAGPGEGREAVEAVRALKASIAALAVPEPDADLDLVAICETTAAAEAS